jgi:hypothetical protein
MKTNKQTKEQELIKNILNQSPDGSFGSGITLAYKQGRKDAIDEMIKIIDKEFEKQRKTTWDDFQEHSNNPLHQSDFIAWKEYIKHKITKEMQK